MTMNMKSLYKACVPALAAAFAFTAIAATAATAQPSLMVKDDAMQLKSDKAALQRQLKRVETDEATLKSDIASGRMSAESKDAYAVYTAKKAVTGEERDIAADKNASLQMKADKAALHRQIKRLEVAEAKLKADTAEGKMAAESKDAEKVYKDQQAMKGEKKGIAADTANLKTDQKK